MPEKMEVRAMVPEKKDKDGKVIQKQLGPVTIVVNTGVNSKDLIELFGDDAVKTNAEANWCISLQSNIRSGLKKGETEAQIQTRLGGAKMGVAQRGAVVDPIQSFIALYASATPQKQAELLAELKSKSSAIK